MRLTGVHTHTPTHTEPHLLPTHPLSLNPSYNLTIFHTHKLSLNNPLHQPQTLTQQPPPPSTNPHLSTPLNNPQTLTQQPTLPPTKSHLTTPSTLHKLSTKNSFNHPQTFTQQHPPHISHTTKSSFLYTIVIFKNDCF